MDDGRAGDAPGDRRTRRPRWGRRVPRPAATAALLLAALPRRAMADLERVFEAPVVESYGMTEAAHQICSNPPPPGQRKPGASGLPPDRRSRSLARAGGSRRPARSARSSIRGPNVMPGYAGAPDANDAAFIDGWFRTGDEGVLDDQGYLTIRGRLKEIINRGGEKVSPHEIEEVLLDHPEAGPGGRVRASSPEPRGRGRGRGRAAARGGARPRKCCAPSPRSGWRGSRCRAGFSCATRSRRGRREKCSGSASPLASV